MDQIPPEFAPGDEEGAVLSVLAVDVNGKKVIRAGSLVTVPLAAAETSWKEWGELQPATRRHMARNEPDLGSSFAEEPFHRVYIHRSMIPMADWQSMVEEITTRHLEVDGGPYCLHGDAWSASKLFAQHGQSDAHEVLWEVKRPVRGVVMDTQAPAMPATEGLWIRGATGFKPAGQRTREELLGTKTFASWPIHLLGVYWPGTDDTSPPHSFVVGRALNRAWIADVVPDRDNDDDNDDNADLLKIAIGWDASEIDPLSCQILVRSEIDGAPLLVRSWKISDLPGEVQGKNGAEARNLPWNKRTLDVRVPRGPRGTCWGVSLIGPDGQLLDERPVARRIERIEMSVGMLGEKEPGIKSIVGDRRPYPTESERNAAVVVAAKLDAEAAIQAAKRRISTAGELEHYLRWRFSARAGELLVLDPYLLDGEAETVERVFAFLLGLGRSIKALTAKVPQANLEKVRQMNLAHFEIRTLPNGTDTLHDRPWLVGETGVLAGASLNHFLKDESAASTAVDLPFADAAAWREKFESWWDKGRRLID
jgi:hypothetical protein